jgi:formamidopyrimidine-DNA glycosylase
VPEGHTIHRIARDHTPLLVGRPVGAASPQGRFAAGAALLDGRVMTRIEPYGKHLFHWYEGGVILHVHLGLYGKWTVGTGAPPAPRGALRLRLTTEEAWFDLRGPIACELLAPEERELVLARLGPDPCAGTQTPSGRGRRCPAAASHRPAADGPAVLAGIGNVYRAEVLYRAGLSPFRPGRELERVVWEAMWLDLRTLLRPASGPGASSPPSGWTGPGARVEPGGRTRTTSTGAPASPAAAAAPRSAARSWPPGTSSGAPSARRRRSRSRPPPARRR